MNRFAQLATNAGYFLKAHSPVILTATAIGGVLTTAVLTHRAGMRAAIDIVMEEDRRADNGVDVTALTFEEKLRLTWRNYIPPVLVGATTIVCIVGAQSINARRQAAVVGLYTVVDQAYREYQEKNLELNGKNQDKKVRDAVAQDRVDAAPDSSIIISGTNMLCYDMYSGRFFESSMEDIRRAQNDINQMIIGDMYASLNDFYALIGLESTVVGEDNGWTVDRLVDINFSAVLKKNMPALAIDFRSPPVPDYFRNK